MSVDSYVQVSPDGSGKKISNVRVVARTVDSSDAVTDDYRYIQRVLPCDDSGAAINVGQLLTDQNYLLDEVRRLLHVLCAIVTEVNNVKGEYLQRVQEAPGITLSSKDL